MSDVLIQLLPARLRANLLPANANDPVSLIQVLELHLKLRRSQEDHDQAPPSQDQQAQLQGLIDVFAAAPNTTAILQVWQQVPQVQEAAFILRIETAIAQDEQAGRVAQAAELRARLDALQQMLDEQRELLRLPEDLLARLREAMADGSSLTQALERHPALQQDFETFIVDHQEQVAQIILRPALADFIIATDAAELWRVWQRTPEELHEAFLAVVDDWISTATQEGQIELVETLQERIARLNHIRNDQERLLEQIWQWITNLAQPLSHLELVDLCFEIPKELREIVSVLAQEQASDLEQASDSTTALRLRGQSTFLRLIPSTFSFVAETTVIQALKTFLGTESDEEAQAMLASHREILLTAHVLEAVKELAAISSSPDHERFLARARMLEECYRLSKDKVNLRDLMFRLITHYGPQLQSADEQQQPHDVRRNIGQMRHAIEWALEHEISQALFLMQSFIPLVGMPPAEDDVKAADWREYLGWCEKALVATDQYGSPADRAFVQILYGHAWQRAATFPYEDRRACLNQALTAYDRASDFFRTGTGAADHLSEIMINRASVIKEIGTLPGEDRRARQYEALAIYDEALRAWSPDPSWLGIALLHSNRANLLREIARLPGEDERTHLHEALSGYEQATRFYAIGSVPVSRAETLLNQAAVLLDLAAIAGEDRRAHMLAALAACDEALYVYLPDQHPLNYAKAQSLRGAALLKLSGMPGEDRLARLSGAKQAYEEAQCSYASGQAPLDHAHMLLQQANLFGDLAALYTYQEALRLNASEQDSLQVQMLLGQGNSLADLAALFGGDRRTWLGCALRAAWMALSIFGEAQHEPGTDGALVLLRGLRLLCGDDFAALWQDIDAGPAPDWGDDYTIDQLLSILSAQVTLDALATFWSQVPQQRREPLLAAAGARILQAQHESDDLVAVSLRQKLDAIQMLGRVPAPLVRQSNEQGNNQ